jgi:hypothetical protein
MSESESSDFDSIIENKYKQIESEKKDYFERKMNKGRRCITKPFRVFMKSKNTKNNNSTSILHNSIQNQSNSSNHFNNSFLNGSNNNNFHNNNARSPSDYNNHSNYYENNNYNRPLSTPNVYRNKRSNNSYNGGRYLNYQESNNGSKRVGFRQ